MVEREQVGLEELGSVELGGLDVASCARAAPEFDLGWGGDVGQVLVDEREAPLGWDAGQQVASVAAELDRSTVGEVSEDVLARDRQALVVEVGDRERVEIEDLRGAERVETVPGSDDQDVFHRDLFREPREGPERDRKPRLRGDGSSG